MLSHAAACWSGFLQGAWPRLIDRCPLCCWAALKITWAVLGLAFLLEACTTEQISDHLLNCSQSPTTGAACRLHQGAHVLTGHKPCCHEPGAACQRSQAQDTCAGRGACWISPCWPSVHTLAS